MKQTRRQLSASERDLAWNFKLAGSGPCASCGMFKMWNDAHHVVSARLLRSEGFPVYDPRNALPLCRDCHERHENASQRVPRGSLTQQNWEFAHEYGLEWYIERFYPTEETE